MAGPSLWTYSSWLHLLMEWQPNTVRLLALRDAWPTKFGNTYAVLNMRLGEQKTHAHMQEATSRKKSVGFAHLSLALCAMTWVQTVLLKFCTSQFRMFAALFTEMNTSHMIQTICRLTACWDFWCFCLILLVELLEDLNTSPLLKQAPNIDQPLQSYSLTAHDHVLRIG